MGSNNRLVFDGIEELREALRALPHELTEEAVGIVFTAAEEAKSEIVVAYPEGPTGNLKKRVRVTQRRSRFAMSAVVSSSAPHAHLYEFGSQVRRVTSTGQNAGAMPAKATFIPVMQRKRRKMYEELIAVLVRNGLLVTGEPD